MSPQVWGLIIGGVIPAICLGLFSIFQKMSTRVGSGPGVFLMIVSIAVFLTGLATYFISGEKLPAIRGFLWAGVCGFLWALGFGCITYALLRFDIPMSKLSPLFNSNTLVAVVLSLWVFAEWQSVSVPKVIVGTVLIVAGAIVVSNA